MYSFLKFSSFHTLYVFFTDTCLRTVTDVFFTVLDARACELRPKTFTILYDLLLFVRLLRCSSLFWTSIWVFLFFFCNVLSYLDIEFLIEFGSSKMHSFVIAVIIAFFFFLKRYISNNQTFHLFLIKNLQYKVDYIYIRVICS